MAIKVNGTTVINDSRALNNIASVDATTVAAMGAAGVGGATKLITANTSLGTASTYSFPLTTRYREYTIAVFNIQHSGSDRVKVQGRFTDTSNNALTASSSYQTKWFDNISNGAHNADYVELYNELYHPAFGNAKISFILNIKNAHTSDMPTTIEYSAWNEFYGLDKAFVGLSKRVTNEVNNAFYLYPTNGVNFLNAYYSMWGVDV